MVDLTVVILTKNEEVNLRKCVESFCGIAKRFVVIDSFSTDKTKEIAQKLDLELRKKEMKLDFFEHEWSNHADQFNWGITNTNITTSWIMRIDADEELSEELSKEIQEKLPLLNDDITGIILRRRVYFLGRWIKHGGRYPEYLLRIFRNGKGRCEQKVMDEHIVVSEGKIVTFSHDFSDYNMKNLEWWTNKHNWYSNLEVLDYQNHMKKISQDGLMNEIASVQAKRKRAIKNGGYYRLPKFYRSHLYFFYRYYIRLGFLDGPEGKIFHFLQAYWYRFLVDAKMYECEKMGRDMEEQGDLKS